MYLFCYYTNNIKTTNTIMKYYFVGNQKKGLQTARPISLTFGMMHCLVNLYIDSSTYPFWAKKIPPEGSRGF